MAGFGDPAPSAPYSLPAPSEQEPSPGRALPNGPCNHRDVATGTCGCDQFWDKCSAELHEGSKHHRSHSERSTWCVCGHHACFHLREARVLERPQPSVAGALYRAHAKCDSRYQVQPGLQCNAHKSVRLIDDGLSPLEGSQAMHSGRLRTSHTGASWRLQRQRASQANGPGLNEQGRDTPSQPSTSGFPRVPSACLLSHDQCPAANVEARIDMSKSRQTAAGLGLSMLNLENVGNSINRQQSPSPTIPDDTNLTRQSHGSYSEPEIPSTRANSVRGEHGKVTNPAQDPLDQVLEFNRNLQLDISGDTIPNTYNPEDFIQSATEVATPSNANTPDLRAADQSVYEGKKLIETLIQLTSNPEQQNSFHTTPSSATSAPAQLLLTNSPSTPQEQLHTVLRSASPQAFHKLVSYLAPLHNLLNSMPNVANTMREFGTRMDLLENNSFNYVHPDDLQQQLDMYEGRLLALESRMDDHEKLHQAIDADQSSNSLNRRRITTITDSFGSNHSAQSTTSSALILAAMDRRDVGTELGDIKDRLDVLEAAAVPTSISPWEVEVVLLPWGRELRGIWYSPDESMHDPSKATTQDSEEWTQARSSRGTQQSLHIQGSQRDNGSSPHPNVQSIFSDTESGWSSQAISDWASGSVNNWLFPKACGSKNLVYKRLQSRGFIRDVTFKSASARDIQATLSTIFNDLLEHLKYTDEDEDPTISSYPGLRAPFIPLRKVIKESKLRFLSPAEMSSSALWSAQFLASGVLMRVSGGRKRLYVTQREAYMQQSDYLGSSWTWQGLRQLPRFQPEIGSQMEGNNEQCQPQVAEADAREACWAFFEGCDAPPSVNSSFSSHHSVQLSMRPADRQWRRSITPSSILKNRAPQPISPLSENHPQRPIHTRNRTVSSSMIEQTLPGSSKRRFNSSPVKHSSAPHVVSRVPSASVARLKRRRVTHSSSPRPETGANEGQDAQAMIWDNTPRRSREPPSPFFSSHPELPRSNSDITSRPSQRSIAAVGKNTPFAYATPHSGPFLGGPGFGGLGNGGDTEPDDDELYDDDNDDISWPGVTDGDENSDSDGECDAGAGVERDEPASLSGDDSGFGSEDDDDEEEEEEENGDDDQSEEENDFGAQRRDSEAEEDGDVFDTLLGVLRH